MIANSGESEGIHADGPQWSALWTRGDGCAELATLLDPEAGRVQGDLREACISARASVLVTRKLSSGLDLTNVAVPHDLEIGSVKAVAALVAGGANSLLAAQVAATLAEALGVPGRMLSAYADDASQPEALTVVERLFVEVPTLEYRAVLADPPADLVAQMREDELMVVGAPAGSWLQRQFFGQGARLVSHAPAGAVVVQAAPGAGVSAYGRTALRQSPSRSGRCTPTPSGRPGCGGRRSQAGRSRHADQSGDGGGRALGRDMHGRTDLGGCGRRRRGGLGPVAPSGATSRSR